MGIFFKNNIEQDKFISLFLKYKQNMKNFEQSSSKNADGRFRIDEIKKGIDSISKDMVKFNECYEANNFSFTQEENIFYLSRFFIFINQFKE